MTFIVYILLFCILFTYFGYPLSLIIVSKLFPVVREKKDITPTVSLLIAAYNEEENIREKIENSLLLDYPRNLLEIVVVSDGSTDRTDEIVKEFADQGIKLFRVEGRVGKTEARNQAVLACLSEIIVFSDATAEYQKDAIKKLIRNFADPKVGMVSGNLVYRNKQGSAMGFATKLYWNYELVIKKSQARLRTLTGAIGCINAFRRKCYTILPPNIIEDFTEPLMILLKGHVISYEAEAIAYERTTQTGVQEFNMRVRVIRGGMSGVLFARKILNPFCYPWASLQLFGHKILRWLMPVFLILLLFFSSLGHFMSHNIFLSILFYSQLLFYVLAFIGVKIENRKGVAKLLSIPAYFVIVNSAALKALLLTLTTKLEATWETNVY